MVLARRHNELRLEEGNAKPGAEDEQGGCLLVSNVQSSRLQCTECSCFRVQSARVQCTVCLKCVQPRVGSVKRAVYIDAS